MFNYVTAYKVCCASSKFTNCVQSYKVKQIESRFNAVIQRYRSTMEKFLHNKNILFKITCFHQILSMIQVQLFISWKSLKPSKSVKVENYFKIRVVYDEQCIVYYKWNRGRLTLESTWSCLFQSGWREKGVKRRVNDQWMNGLSWSMAVQKMSGVFYIEQYTMYKIVTTSIQTYASSLSLGSNTHLRM